MIKRDKILADNFKETQNSGIKGRKERNKFPSVEINSDELFMLSLKAIKLQNLNSVQSELRSHITLSLNRRDIE